MNDMKKIGIVLLVAWIGSALGCAVDQKQQIAIYRKVIDNNQASGVKIEPDQVVTLTDALKLANENNEQLSIQGETYLQALIQKDRTFSNFLPMVNFTPSYSAAAATNNTFGRTTTGWDVPVTGQINIFNGFQDYHTLLSNEHTAEQQKQLILDLQQTVLLDVAQAYYQVLTSEQSVDVLTNSISVQQARVDNIQAQAKVGTARPLDVAQAQAQLSETQVSLNQSKADVRNGRAMLAFLVNAPIENNPLHDDYEAPTDLPPLQAWIDQAEAGRQDLLAADAAVESARENVLVAWGQYYPSLNLNLTYQLYNEVAGGGGGWQGLFTLNLPLFTGGLIDANVRGAWSSYRQAALTQAQLRRSIDQDVQTAYTNLLLARQQLKELQVEVEAARQALFLADQEYKEGAGTLLDVLVAQDTLLTTQLQLTEEQFGQKTAYFNMLRTVGTLTLTMGGESVSQQNQQAEQHLRELATQPTTRP
jgi:outer membrane protein